jgi:GNAT superfamily N-acetyltransferase
LINKKGRSENRFLSQGKISQLLMGSLSEIEIRSADPADGAAILRSLQAAFAPYRNDYTPAAFADTVLSSETLHVRLQQMHILVASVTGNVVGTVAGVCNAEDGHLRGMAVLPECHGMGVAAKLLAAIETWLRGHRCKRITLDTTLPLVPAMKFYERNGYHRSGKIADFFGMPLVEYVKQL